MNELVTQIVVLNSFARKGDYINESWASREFGGTYAAAVKACGDKITSTMGVDINWSPNRPEVLHISRRGIISERTEFSRDLPLEGEVGRALLTDLQALAVGTAIVHIKAERDAALVREATERVASMLRTAATANAACTRAEATA